MRADGTVKVLDFGLAKALAADRRRRGGGRSRTRRRHSLATVAPRHRAGHDSRHGRLHGAGAGARQSGRQARRHLGVRRRPVRNAHRAAPRLPARPSPTSSRPSSRASRTGRRCPPTRRHRSDGCSRAVSRKIRSAGCATSATRGWKSRKRRRGSRALPRPHAGPVRATGSTRGQKLAWTLAGATAAALGLVAVVLSGVWPRARVSESRPLRVSIVHTDGSEVAAPAISPDGRRVAYRATTRRRHAAALGARSGQRRRAAAARHRGCRHALLVAGLARPGVLHRRDVEARVGGGRPGARRDRQRRRPSPAAAARGAPTGRLCSVGRPDSSASRRTGAP